VRALPAEGVAQIPVLLERLVRATGLADDVAYTSATSSTSSTSRASSMDAGEAAPSRPSHRGAGVTTTEVALVPVRRTDGYPQGLLRCRPRPGTLSTIEDLATLAGAAMGEAARAEELAVREAALRRVAERLQDSLLPVLPALPSTLLEVVYRAAARDARVGGDFYDAFALPDGNVLLVVGDVMGKGVEAASRTSRITQTFRALAMQGLPLDRMLERVCEQVVFQDPEIMATMWAGLYEPLSGQLVFASCGHPPALLLRPEGPAAWLNVEGLPLGMHDLLDEIPETRSRVLGSRDLLVLYTDGLIEASGDVIAGQEALLHAIESRRDSSLRDLVVEVSDELLHDAGHTDDAVLLVLRRM